MVIDLDIVFRADGNNRGLHSLSGRTLIAGTPDIVAPDRPVQLFSRQKQPVFFRQMRSSSSGVYKFDNVSHRLPGDGYVVVAYDLLPAAAGQYDPAAKSDQIPSPMPPDPSEH